MLKKVCVFPSFSLSSFIKIEAHLIINRYQILTPNLNQNCRCLDRFTLDAHVKSEHYNGNKFFFYCVILKSLLFLIVLNVYSSDKVEEIKKQLYAVKKHADTPTFPDSVKMEEILLLHCDATCDYCDERLPPSLEQVQSHYVMEHTKNGYLKCCNQKLETMDHIYEHAIFHLYPEYYK